MQELNGLEGSQTTQLNLYNSLGAIVWQQYVVADEAGSVNEQLTIGSKLPSGIYILKAGGQNKTVTQKLVIHK